METSNALVIAEVPKFNCRIPLEDFHKGKSWVHRYKQADVPTIGANTMANQPASLVQYRDDLKPYTTKMIDLAGGSHITTLCDRGLCCDFHLETTYDESLASKPNVNQYKYVYILILIMAPEKNEWNMAKV